MNLRQVLREGVVAGTTASVLSTLVLAFAGWRETGSAAAPTNAEGHWLRGDDALRDDGLTWAGTATGYLTHHLSTVFWATLYSAAWGHRREAKSVAQAVLGGAATAAAAAAIDYTLVPERLTPGFERRLSTPATVATFGAIAAGLALGALLLRERD